MTWNWWVHSNGGLAARILIGATIFAVLAVADLLSRGRSATRWREYLFLLVVVAAAMLFGALNDQISSRVSWEYFYFGKELAPVLGPATPPDPAALHWAAAKIGMMATWSAGLLLGVVLLLMNNPRRDRPRLPYRRLFAKLPVILIVTVACGALGGILGYRGNLTWMSADFREMVTTGLWRPQHFMCTYGIHLGDYIGGGIGTILAVWMIARERAAMRRLASPDTAPVEVTTS